LPTWRPYRTLRRHRLRGSQKKAAAFNRKEKYRDPSTVEFRPLGWHFALFESVGLPAPATQFYQVPAERERLIAASFPANDERALLRRMIDEAVEGDRMGLTARRDRDTVKFAYPAAILVVEKPAKEIRPWKRSRKPKRSRSKKRSSIATRTTMA
jgi:hypothetical protein